MTVIAGYLQAEMKSFTKCDGTVLKHHFEKKIVELEEEKNALQVFSFLTSVDNHSNSSKCFSVKKFITSFILQITD